MGRSKALLVEPSREDIETIRASELFDAEWYLENYPDVKVLGIDPAEHYLWLGVRLNRDPSPHFNTCDYLASNDTVAKAGINPLLHYIRRKGTEGASKASAAAAPASASLAEGVSAHRRSFVDFAGFLAASMVSPIVHAPFREADKRCFAMMEAVARQLSKRAFSLSPRPLVSVIMPVHNRLETVERAVQSVLQQQYEQFELIIVDDGSDDGTYESVSQTHDARITVLRNETNGGVSVARNMGLRAANGAYIAYLDSDNFWDDRYLAAIVGAFAERPDADSLYSGQLLFRGDNIQPFAARYGHFNRALLENRNYIDLNAFCHRIGIGKQLGGFDESLSRFVDYDLVLRASEQGTIVSVPVLLSHYHFDKAARTITNDDRLAPQIDLVWAKMEQRATTGTMPAPPESRRKKVSVVIPSYQSLEDIVQCMQALLELQLEWVEIVVVDNASDASVREFLSNLWLEGTIKLVQNEVNFGFTYAVNQGIAASSVESDILIMNNDAIVAPGAIQEMQFQMYRLDNAGIVVPRQVLPGGTATITQHVPFAQKHRACDVNLSAHHQNIVNPPLLRDGGPVELSFAPFFCAYISRDCLSKADGLDAEYGRHYRSDRLFCDFVRHVLGRKIYYLPSAIVHHKLQKSTNALRANDKDTFNVMFRRNQWDEDTAKTLGYRRPVWDR